MTHSRRHFACSCILVGRKVNTIFAAVLSNNKGECNYSAIQISSDIAKNVVMLRASQLSALVKCTSRLEGNNCVSNRTNLNCVSNQ